MRVRAVALMALPLGPAGCVDRSIGLADCDDGRRDRGEVCLADASDVRRADFEPLAFRIADFDGDGHIDYLMLGVVDWAIRSVLIPGDGTGRLGEGHEANVHGCSAYPIPGDIDGDAASDLLFPECGPSMLVFSGGEDGFGAGRSVATGATARTSAILDVDRDGANDIVVLGADDAGLTTLNVALGDGDDGFATPEASPFSELLAAFHPSGFHLGDIDEDGTLDALYVDASEGTGGLAHARGLGDGRFAAPEILDVGVTPGGAWLRDFDGDGHLDLLVLDRTEPELALAFLGGDGRGAFAATALTPLGTERMHTTVMDDLDGDGDDDIVLGHADHSIVDVWLGEGDGRFEGPTEVDVGGVPQQMATGDFNEDGAMDLVVGTFADGGIRVLLAEP